MLAREVASSPGRAMLAEVLEIVAIIATRTAVNVRIFCIDDICMNVDVFDGTVKMDNLPTTVYYYCCT